MGGCKSCGCFLAVFFVLGRRGLATLLLFLYVTEESGRKYGWDMPWPPVAECNMITNKQTKQYSAPVMYHSYHSISALSHYMCQCAVTMP